VPDQIAHNVVSSGDLEVDVLARSQAVLNDTVNLRRRDMLEDISAEPIRSVNRQGFSQISFNKTYSMCLGLEHVPNVFV